MPEEKRGRKEGSISLGARVCASGTEFTVWAPACRRVEVVVGEYPREDIFTLGKRRDGYFSGLCPGIKAGRQYKYRLEGKKEFPDPCSRFQPRGPSGPSLIIDPREYRWHDAQWPGLKLAGQVFYEMHVGTFAPQGTFEAAGLQLEELRGLGITCIELMPLNEYSGRWNWGYDGVNLFAPSHNYGTPSALKNFVDTAHRLGIGVLLDVVYNHLGAEDCYLQEFSPHYFSRRYGTDWGRAVNFDGQFSDGVRQFFIQNAVYWIREYHFDGLRVDATQNIYDQDQPHILSEITSACRRAAGKRKILLVAENEPQDTRCLVPAADGGFGFDAMWNDDFHHSVRVAATGFREAYFQDYRGNAQELISLVKRGFLFQGQYYSWQKKERGFPVTREAACAFVVYLQNHDQIGNQLEGKRITRLISLPLYRALATFMMLSPCTPMIFMGQEFASSSRFPFFADMPHIEKSVFKGRKKYLQQFPSYASPRSAALFPHPCRESTFRSAGLDFSERAAHAPTYLFHKKLIALRRRDPVIALQSRECVEGSVLEEKALVLRYQAGALGERLLLVNYGETLTYSPAPEPLLSSGPSGSWKLLFSSDDPQFGGANRLVALDLSRLRIPGQAAFFFKLARPGKRWTSA